MQQGTAVESTLLISGSFASPIRYLSYPAQVYALECAPVTSSFLDACVLFLNDVLQAEENTNVVRQKYVRLDSNPVSFCERNDTHLLSQRYHSRGLLFHILHAFLPYIFRLN